MGQCSSHSCKSPLMDIKSPLIDIKSLYNEIFEKELAGICLFEPPKSNWFYFMYCGDGIRFYVVAINNLNIELYLTHTIIEGNGYLKFENKKSFLKYLKGLN